MMSVRIRTNINLKRVAAAAGILLCSGMFWIKPSDAMENLKVVRGVLILEGKIEEGDYVSVRKFLGEPSNWKKMNGNVFLASPGGNVFEALQIGYLIRRLQLSTDAPSSPPMTARSSGSEVIHPSDLTNPKFYQCTSACFLLYVAGIYREFIWVGRLGIHHPQVERKAIGATEQDISIEMDEMRNKLKRYFEEMNVPIKYLDLTYSLPTNEIRWITQNELNADLKGYIPEVQSLLDAKCNSRLGAGHSDAIIQKCVTQIRGELRSEAWQKVFHRD